MFSHMHTHLNARNLADCLGLMNHFRTTFWIHSCFRWNLKWDSDKNFPQSLEKASEKVFTPTGKIFSFLIKAYSTVITAIPMPVWKNQMVMEEVQSILMSSHFPSTLGNTYCTICQASDHLLSEGGLRLMIENDRPTWFIILKSRDSYISPLQDNIRFNRMKYYIYIVILYINSIWLIS